MCVFHIFSGESQKMKRRDKAKKVFGVIVVPLILNSLTRRFKAEGKGKLWENKRVVNYYES